MCIYTGSVFVHSTNVFCVISRRLKNLCILHSNNNKTNLEFLISVLDIRWCPPRVLKTSYYSVLYMRRVRGRIFQRSRSLTLLWSKTIV
jgi:hypothetical protein